MIEKKMKINKCIEHAPREFGDYKLVKIYPHHVLYRHRNGWLESFKPIDLGIGAIKKR